MAYVRMQAGVVVQRQPYPAAGFVEAPDDVVCGMVDTGDGVYAPAKQTIAQRKAALYEAISAKRKAVETGGVEVGGAMIRTDATSQAKISGAIAFAAADPELVEIDWEAMPGVWITLDVAALTAIGVAVGRHVQACFSQARALSQAVSTASTHAALDAIDIETGWAV